MTKMLFHGSNVEVCEPKIISPARRLDFGSGFYLTTNFDQAARWAELTVRRKEFGVPVVSVFEFDENCLDQLRCLHFDGPSREWLRFVSANRRSESFFNDFDLVYGPVANDRTMPVISLFLTGVYDEDETIKRLLPQKLCDQYAFRTESALKLLKFMEVKRK